MQFFYKAVYSGNYEDSKRSSASIGIYNHKGRVGSYYVGGGFDTIPSIKDQAVVLRCNDTMCPLSTNLDFKDSIPQQIFIHCVERDGDLGDL